MIGYNNNTNANTNNSFNNMTTTQAQNCYGKYRGKVIENDDPDHKGRIQASVPDIYDSFVTGWALPCTPYGGNNVGFFFIPPKEANVWIEFENGNPDYPIWVGCFWGNDELESDKAVPDTKMIKTEFATMTIKDDFGTGEVKIETTNGLKFVMDNSGIELSNGTFNIKMTALSVSINDGALVVK